MAGVHHKSCHGFVVPIPGGPMYCYAVPEASVNVRWAKVREETEVGKRTRPNTNTTPGPGPSAAPDRDLSGQVQADDCWDDETFE
jgi:hypothetical protein